ncbi:hypothetical protein [Georgenia sp. SUBG003]|uniref:hypothetical protein n=1 Tax=Georgenia sp. SUBG003 TaxID=1497974 RepID=UPI003AB1E904
MLVARGLAEIISNRRTQIVDVDGYLEFFRADILGVPVIVWIFVLVAVGGWVLPAFARSWSSASTPSATSTRDRGGRR